MKTTELMAMLKTAHDLGHRDITIMLDESRDGETHYAAARARLVVTSDQREPITLLIVGYDNG